MMVRAVLVVAAATGMLYGPGVAAAAAVEFDTKDAHVIVIRPVDVWSRDQARSDETLEVIRKKTFNYSVSIKRYEALFGGPTMFHSVSDSPLIASVDAQATALGFEVGRNQDYRFAVAAANQLAPSEFAGFRAREEEVLHDVVIAQGDPSTLRSRVGHGKFVGGVASVLTLGVAAKVGGANFANASLNSGVIGDVYEMNQRGSSLIVPAHVPELNVADVSLIEVRRVAFFGAMIGQIIIAYRGPKSDEAELEALAKAIVYALGRTPPSPRSSNRARKTSPGGSSNGTPASLPVNVRPPSHERPR